MSHNIALFAGTFDPYTNGHHDIVRKAAALFDEVVVLVGVNVHKARSFDAGAMRDAIQAAIDADGLSSVQSLSRVQLFAPHELQHARPPCPSQTPGVHPDSSPSSQ